VYPAGMATKAAAKKTTAAPKKAAPAKKVFGRPGTAGKAEGDAAVKSWMRGVDPAHRPIVQKLDALIGDVVPNVKRAIKWSTPIYGIEGQGWIASIASFKNYVSLGFFSGASLKPPPPFGEGKGMRRINLKDMSEVDERLFRSWVKQASQIKGWGTV
jgi:hypothetical protein